MTLNPGLVYVSNAERTGLPQFYGYEFIFLVLKVYEERPGWPLRANILMLSSGHSDKDFNEGLHTITRSWWLWRNARRFT